MANYSVDIELSVKGLNQLRQLEKEITSLEEAAKKITTFDVSGATKKTVSVLEAERRALQLSGKERRQNLILANRAEETERKINAVLERRQALQARQNTIAARGSQALSSALIGGGFPLLFGQGGIAAAGGAIGGLAGGALGGGFGFALSIIGTAIGDALTKADDFDKALTRLNGRTASLGDTALLTSRDIDDLARSLGIGQDKALELLQSFSEFDRAISKTSLALIFGDDPAAFDRLAAATTEADLAKEIFASRKQIGLETTDQLLNQLRVKDAASVELALAEARLAVAEKQAIKDAERVTLMDRMLAAIVTAQTMGAGTIVDPKDFGTERAQKLQAEFDKKRNERLDEFKKQLGVVRSIIGKVESFQPDKGAGKRATEAERLRKEAERLLEASQKRVRELEREAETIRRITQFKNVIAGLERVEDASSAVRVQGEMRLFELEQARVQTIERINPKLTEQQRLLEETAINNKFLAESDEVRNEIARRLGDIQYRNAQIVKDAMLENSEQVKLMERQQELADGISQTLGTSMMSAFDSLILGAQRFDEALRNIVVYTLQEMARQLLQIFVIEQAIAAIRGIMSPGTIPFPGHVTHGQTRMQPLPPLPGLATGGPAQAGKSYIVGERGPELFTPSTSGVVTPNHALGMTTPNNVIVNVDATGSSVEGSADQANQLGKAIGLAVQQELIKQKRPGGLLA